MSQVTGRSPQKSWLARVVNGEIGKVFHFQINPTAAPRTRTVNYTFNSPPGSPLPTATFDSISGDTFSITLLLDATWSFDAEKLGTLAQQAELELYTQPDADRYIAGVGQFISPPRLRFGVGDVMTTVVVTSLGFRDVRWNTSMMPTRTFADIQMRAVWTGPAELRNRLARLQQLSSLVTADTI